MFSRFNVAPLVRGHVKGLSRFDRAHYVPDWGARLFIVAPSLILAAAAVKWDWTLQAPAALLTASALLAGGALSSFTHLSTLRYRWTEQMDDESLDPRRDAVDEAAAHLLLATLLSITMVVLLVIGTNVAPPPSTSGGSAPVPTYMTAPIVAVGSYVVALFVLALPRLYQAYVDANHVRSYLNGFHSGPGTDRRLPRQSTEDVDS